MRVNFRFLTLVFSALLCLVASAVGQETTGNIEGYIRDATGAVVPNVSVTIRNLTATTDASGTTTTGTSRGFSRTVVADAEGFFRVLQVPPGVYVVTTASASGFGEARYENVQVTLGRTTQLEIQLAAGQASATVNVGASDQPVDTTSSEISTSINAQKIELVPKGVDFTSVLKTIPGTRPDPFAGGFSIDGATNSENVFVIDGQEVTNYNNAGINRNNQIPFQLVQEVQVKASGFDAEFGGATGGVINVVTKGGSDDLRGEFGLQFRTSRLDGAQNPLLTRFTSGSGASFLQTVENVPLPKTRYLHTLPTATLSGPIVKNRLWFFTSYTPQIFDLTANTTFYSNQPASLRTITGSDEYRRKDTYEYVFGRLDAQPFGKLRLSGTFLWNPHIIEGLTPYNTVNFGADSPVNFGGDIGVLQGSRLRNRQGGRNNSNNTTFQAVYTALENLVGSFRYSRGFLNEKGTNYFVPTAAQYQCTAGNVGATVFPGACNQGFISPSNTRNVKDVSVRTTYEADATVLFNAAGRHQVKGGYQYMTIFNDLEASSSQIIFLAYGDYRINSTPFQWSSTATPNPNAIGAGALYRFAQVGQGSNLNQAVYVQDKWQPTKRLTLNLGLRVEKEDIPSYNEYPATFDFGWGEKIAPRLGFAYDLTGDGKTKIFGSYGKFYDRLKFHLAQGSFGGDFYRVDFFDILPTSGAFTNFTIDSVLGNFDDRVGGACPATGFIGSGLSRCQIDLRVASNNPDADPFASGAIDPNAKPYQQREFTVGFERELSRDYVFRGRYTNKKLINAIEDAGVADESGSEIFITGNPGQGLHAEFLEAFGIEGPYAVPRRRYDALELVLEKRLSNNYFFNFNYTLSRLYGNYSGLSNSDEQINVNTTLNSQNATGALNGLARSNPGVNRSFDLPHIGYTAAGGFDDGRLATDRPHVFNAYGAYIFDWRASKSNSTEFSVFQTVQSGTPQTTFIQFAQATTIFTERGDLGRTETFSQTDLGVTHRYRFGRDNRFTFVADLNVLNLWDERNVLQLWTTKTSGQISLTGANAAFPQFVLNAGTPQERVDKTALLNAYIRGDLLAGINAYLAGTPTALNRTDARYGLPQRWQDSRQVRFGFRLLF